MRKFDFVYYNLYQGGPNFLFSRAKNSLTVEPESHETPPGTIFKKVYPFFVIFNNTYSEISNYHSICSNMNVIEMCTHYYRAMIHKVWFANPQGFADCSRGFARKQFTMTAVLIVTDIIFYI
jgi:hypothetical protein